MRRKRGHLSEYGRPERLSQGLNPGVEEELAHAMSFTQEELEQYSRDGFIFVRNLLDAEDLSALRQVPPQDISFIIMTIIYILFM